MAENFKVLFRGTMPQANSIVYTAPALTTTLVSSIFISNTSGASSQYNINLDGYSIATNISLPGNNSVVIEPKQVLESGQSISVNCNTSGLELHISGIEIS